MICPLCLHPEINLFAPEKNRDYVICNNCSLVFVPRDQIISTEREKLRYEAHDNSEQNENYKSYLSSIAQSIFKKIPNGLNGLDFGSGKTTIMADFFKENGFHMESYDIFFKPDSSLLEKKYDFVLMSEVIEHLRQPELELRKIVEMLKQESFLFIKTKLLPEKKEDFKNWFYKRDITHIQFFSLKTFDVLSEKYGMSKTEQIDEDLFLLRYNRREVAR